MPLHKSIPLCNFKYAGDILSSATFIYDTVSKINKEQNKLLYVEENSSIDKSHDIYMYNEIKNIDRVKVKALESKIKSIDIIQIKELSVGESLLIKEESKTLSTLISGIHIEYKKHLSNIINDINITSLKHLCSPLITQLNIESYKGMGIDMKRVNINKSMELGATDNKQIIKNIELGLLSPESLNVDKEINFNLQSQPINQLNIHSEKSIKGSVINDIYLSETKYYKYIEEKTLDKIFNVYYDKISDKLVDKKDQPSYLYRDTINHIFNNTNIKFTDRVDVVELHQEKYTKLFYRYDVSNVDKYEYREALGRITLKYMNKDKSLRHFYRKVLIGIDNAKFENYLYKDVIIPTHKNNSENYLDRDVMVDIFTQRESYLDRDILVDIFNIGNMYLKDIPIIPVFKQMEKSLLDITIPNVYKEHDKYLKRFIDNIHKENHVKFIELTQRWWWLNETNPRDKLIVPNMDYANMVDLLNNDNFEYLRYDNHPIDWGSNWGKDWNIPPYAVSIEIMLDLVNIITMIWHKNVQGWLSVTGKEAIQLLMELLYDWYSMNTSSPNQSYKRAYRWIRWESEKVYFLDIKNGLQAIGILVANLIDYLKNHHFNVVPIWIKPSAMDEMRNFNRVANNGDLMQDLDKNKGNRHYLIETQNFEKKDIFRR